MEQPKDNERSWLSVPVHPILLAAYSVLFLYSQNTDSLFLNESVRPLVVCVGIATVLLGVLRLAMKDISGPAIYLSVGIALLFSYGHLADLTDKISDLPPVVFWGALSLIAFILLRQVLRRVGPVLVSQFLNVVAIALIAMTLWPIGLQQARAITPVQQQYDANDEAQFRKAFVPKLGYYPDIYYIILDGHGRADVLKLLYGEDIGEFLGHLRDKGFYVASESRSHYTWTMPSMASSLNMRYVHEIPGLSLEDTTRLRELVRHNGVCRLLKSIGYKTVLVPSIYSVTDAHFPADIRMGNRLDMTYFELELLRLTPLRIPQRMIAGVLASPLSVHRKRTLAAFDALGQVPTGREPLFVYAHIICPHPPFVFDRNGDTQDDVHGWLGGPCNEAWEDPAYCRPAYARQVAFVDGKMREVIERILARSSRAPIIVVQADHGPYSRLLPTDVPPGYDEREIDNWQRTSILNVYYLPGGGKRLLYPDINPVNTFRIISNYYFGTNFRLLPDSIEEEGWDSAPGGAR